MVMLMASLVLTLFLPQAGLGQGLPFPVFISSSLEVVPAGEGPPGDTLWLLCQG